MSETVTTVPMDDAALFNSATSDPAPVTDAPAQEAAPAQPEDAGPARDEQGRFAAKEATAEEAAPQEAKPDAAVQEKTDNAQEKPGWVPAWRASEIAEARRSAEARQADSERRAADLERHIHQLQGQLRQFTDKPAEAIDPYIDPEKFADQRARQAVDPVKSQVDTIREYYSRKDAIRAHGAETVAEAYKWLDTAARANDPSATAFVQRVMTSIDPFEEIVTAYKRGKALSTVGDDPNAWFDKELERRKADPALAAKLGLSPAQAASPTNIVKLPPSLNRAASGGNKPEDLGDLSDASLFAHATR